jgi:hypothetical protein
LTGGQHLGFAGQQPSVFVNLTKPAAALIDLKQDAVIALGSVDRPQDVHIRRVFDHPASIQGRKPDIGNHGVSRIVRINLTERPSNKFFVLSNIAEVQPLECRRLDAGDNDFRNSRLRQ